MDGLTQDQANCLIQAQLEDDANGFFLAYFEQISSVIQRPTHPIVEVIEGLELYNGQFQNITMPTTTKPTRQAPHVKDNGKQLKPEESQSVVKNKTAVTNTGVKTKKIATPQPKVNCKTTIAKKGIEKSKVLVKKAAKKQAWKEKQMGQKKTRLLKKAGLGLIQIKQA